ncbi:hypothetical protein [Peribacillus sp. NPDC096540]
MAEGSRDEGVVIKKIIESNKRYKRLLAIYFVVTVFLNRTMKNDSELLP